VGTYSISDLSELTGVKTHTLRIWEKRYGLLQPQRTDTNIRYYADSDLKTLRMVQRLTNQGVRISKIAGMTVEEMEEECKRITLRHEDYEEKLEGSVIEMDATQMETILDESIRQHGFDTTLSNLILPFLEKMEVMWLTGNIGEPHEACLRELVKRKTLREIDTIPQNCSGPRVITFLPKGNKQELNHLFMHYFLRRQGLCVTDIGSDISLDCATSALNNGNAECVLIVNADPLHWQFSSFIRDLDKRTSLPIIISGRASDDQLHFENKHVIVLEGMEETLQFVNRLQENLRSHSN
jgi:MerR family transcriptional regulator, light-induced transcriptional regulator